MSSFRDKLKQQSYQKFIPRKFEFHENFEDNIQLDAVTQNGHRTYTSPTGNQLTSMTTMLSIAQSEEKRESLKRWKERIGEDAAAKVLSDAVARGNLMHNMCETYIADPDNFIQPEPNTNAYALFKQIYPCFDKFGKIHGIEKNLYSDSLGLAGTADCIAEYDGELSIIDFKTSTKEKYESYIQDYFLQATGYSLMYSAHYDLKVKQIVILMARDYGVYSDPQIWVRPTIDYVKPFTEKLKRYRQIMNDRNNA